MTEIIGVRFKKKGKVYSFAPGDLNPAEGSYVMVETARGLECGEVAVRRHAVPDHSITAPLKTILRIATKADMAVLEQNRNYMAEAFRVCEQCIAARKLPMHLVDVECGFDSNKLIFYFTAESRVDFRELVKDLAATFHVRIELRQIGDRDEAKLLGGLGICGREFCCKRHLDEFQPITIKMAKEQGLALNPAKISGTCGRLMCCLRYESPVYEELIHFTPKVGSTVLLPGDPPVRAYVMEANLITGKLRVKPENAEMPITVDRTDVERLQDLSKRMTKEDLRDTRRASGRSLPTKPPVSNLADAAASAPDASADAATTSAPKPQRQPRQNARQRNCDGQHTQQPKPQGRSAPQQTIPQRISPTQAASAMPAAASTVSTTEASALHPEFGETKQMRQSTVSQKPVRHTMNLDAMDLTEHRAAADTQVRSAEQRTDASQGGDRRNPSRGGKSGNRRYHNNQRRAGEEQNGNNRRSQQQGNRGGNARFNHPPRPPKQGD